MIVLDAAPDAAAVSGPYVGLTYYTEDNAMMFFGRDAERAVLISNLRASRLTLLYAESGTGKSSLLRAGVAAKLGELARRSLQQRGTARNIPVVFSSWRDDPTGELITEIGNTVQQFVPGTEQIETAHGRLDEALEAASRAADATMLVMLDQFEEYFLYRSRESRDGRFADELAGCINRPDLRANFLISIREDSYSGLGDLFKRRIDNVYGNYLHLTNLSRECGRQAIERPIASFNELHPHEAPVEIEPGLVDAVLDQLRPGQIALEQAGRGRISDANGAGGYDDEDDEVAAPYLQLVMKRLWETELPSSRKLRLATLEQLGGAQTIVRTHVDRALSDLPPADREAAVDFFRHLVTPSGTKIALAASDLAEYTSRSTEDASALLERLASSDTRILRPVPPPPGHDSGTRFEISHDLLAPAILDWGSRQRAVRLEHEKEAAERQVRVEKRRARTFRVLALVSAILLVIAIILGINAHNASNAAQSARHEAESRAIAASAEASLSQDPEMSALLALRALGVSRTAQAQTALRDALPEMQLKATLAPPPPQRSAAFSADGTQILTASADGSIRIWNAATDKQTLAVSGFGLLNSAAFSPDGTQIVTASDDGSARVLDARTGKIIAVLTPPQGAIYAVSSAAFSPDGKLIVTTYADGTARIWAARTGKLVSTLAAEPGTHVLLDAAFSPSGKLVVTAGSSGNARIFDPATGRQVAVLPGSIGLLSAAFSPNGKFVITACGDGTARIWDVRTHRQVGALTPAGNQYMLFGAAFSPDGQQVVTSGGDGVARVWDATTHRQVLALGKPGSDSLESAAFSPDGKLIVTASAGGLVRVWNASSGRQIALLPSGGGSSRLQTAAFSPDGTLAATGSQFGTVTLWRAPAARPRTPGWKRLDVISIPEGDAVNGLAFSSDGTVLVTANQSGRAYVWQVPNGLPDGEFNGAEGQPLTSVAFDPVNPALVVTADDDGYARIFKISTDQQVGSPFGEPLWDMNGVAFSPDGKQIVTVSSDGYARLWNAANQTEIGAKFGYGTNMTSVAFSSNGKLILTTDRGGFTDIWNVTNSTPTFNTSFQCPSGCVTEDAAMSADSRTVVSAGADGVAREWDLSTGDQVLALAGDSGQVTTVAYSGTEIITTGSDGTAQIWDAEPIEQRDLLQGSSGMQVLTAAFDPANAHIVATANDDGTVSVWSTAKQSAPITVLTVPSVVSAEFSNDGKFLVTAGNEQVQVWRMSKLDQPFRSIDTTNCSNPDGAFSASLNSATFSGNGKLIVTADEDGAACVWSVSTGQLMRQFTEPSGVIGGVTGGISGAPMNWAVFSPDGKQVLTASNDGTARIWNLRTGHQVQVLSEPTDEGINSARFSPDGRLVVTASADGTARIWSATSGTLLQTLNQPGLGNVANAAFSPEGHLIVSCSSSAAAIWNSAGQQLVKFQYWTTLSDCEFNENGSEIVTAGDDAQTRIFSTELAGGLGQIEKIAQERMTQLSTG